MGKKLSVRTRREKRGPTDLLAHDRVLRIEVQGGSEAIRLDRFLGPKLHWLSRRVIRERIEKGLILVNDARGKPGRRVRAGDVITAEIPSPATLDVAEQDLCVDVIYEDNDILVVNKAPHVVVHPTGRRVHGTLIQAILHRYRDAMRNDPQLSPRLLHRLDRETSGVLMVSKRETVHRTLARQFEKRMIRKEYLAVVEGAVHPDSGEIRFPLGLASASAVNVKMAVRQDIGKPASTEYHVRDHLPGHTLLSLFPHTGRQHQLRVHLAAMGHPIVADQLYKDEKLFLEYVRGGLARRPIHPLLGRHALHAWRITLDYDGRERTFEAPLAEDLVRLVAHLRGTDSPPR